jgi:hypothetical protein
MMPLTMEQYARSLKEPALCEQLNIHDLLDNVAVALNGSLVAGYELSGLHSYYGSDEERNRTKGRPFPQLCRSSRREPVSSRLGM